MNCWRWAAGLGVLGLFLLAADVARAERVPSSKAYFPPNTGARTDITVPYLTNGYSALGVANGVAPRVYSSPIVNDPTNPQARPVFNLPFYGAVMSFGGSSNGATPRPPGPPLGPAPRP
jgi:hypothetical protein